MPTKLKLTCENGHDTTWIYDGTCSVLDLSGELVMREPVCPSCGSIFRVSTGRYVADAGGLMIRSEAAGSGAISGDLAERSRKKEALQSFRDDHYVRHNQRRQEHLASLGLSIEGRSVLELGAGIGDHTTFFIDRNCSICVSDGRQDLYEILRDRYHWMRTELIDIELPDPKFHDVYEIVYAYGLLYHLSNPAQALDSMSKWCSSLLLLETCVSPGDDVAINLTAERQADATQAVSGTGCRPTRRWVFEALQQRFEHVYATVTQPWHPEFPLDWSTDAHTTLTRAVFVASRTPLNLPTLTKILPTKQVRH